MEPTCNAPRLVFPDGFTERDELEMKSKGFLYACLECDDGCRYQVMFIDPVRLARDIEVTVQSGQPYYYEFLTFRTPISRFKFPMFCKPPVLMVFLPITIR